MRLRLTLLIVGLAVLVTSSSCKKKSKGSRGDAAKTTVAPTTTSTPPEGSLRVRLEGVPSAYSSASEMRVMVRAEGGDFYRYGLLHDTSDCAEVKFSAWRELSAPIEENLKADGSKVICVLVRSAAEAVNVSATSYRWIKDSSPPVIGIDAISGFGPHYTLGPKTVLKGSAKDTGSAVAAMTVSIQKDGAGCLNEAGEAFDAPCPNRKPALLEDGAWSLSFSDIGFTPHASYQVLVHGTDTAGNEGAFRMNATWDTSPPSSPGSPVVTQGAERLGVSWSGANGATRYLVVRREGSAPTLVPSPSMSYQAGQLLDAVHAVAYFGAATTFVDENLLPYTTYHYAVHAVDDARNISLPSRGQGLTGERQRFRGISHAALVSEDKTIRVEWQPFAPKDGDAEAMTYELYVASSPGEQDFHASPQATILGGQSLYYRYGGTASVLYFVVRAREPNGQVDDNRQELAIHLAGTSHHKIGYNGRFFGHAPLATFIDNPWAVAKDAWGNYLFSGDAGLVNVLCQEVDQAPYCKQRVVGRVYTVGGSDGIGNASNDVPVACAGIGLINAIAVDPGGNVYLSDATNFTVRALCFAPLQAGFCYAKKQGQHYLIIGSGVAGDGGNGASASRSSIGTPTALTLTLNGDIIVGDNSYRRIRVICVQNSAGFCAGKSVESVYSFVGTGASGDGADDTVASTALPTGDIGALSVDGADNIYWTDTAYRRVRVICQNVENEAGFCKARTRGRHYRIMGTGVAGNSGDDAVSTGEAMGQSFGLSLDDHKNILVSDLTYSQVRLICQSTAGLCSGRTAGNVYRYAGTGVATVDGADDTAMTLAGLGDVRGLALGERGNLIVADSRFKYLRALCAEDVAGTLCEGVSSSHHRRVVGTGSSYSGAEHLSALNTPLGTLQGTAVDPNGNVYVADSVGARIRVICFNTAAPGFCESKTYGFTYFAVGTGAAGDGTDGSALTRAIGAVYGLASDGVGNIYMADTRYRRIRVLCNNVDAPGYCNGKSVGHTYRLAGTGAAGDGVDNTPALTSAMGQPYGVALDRLGNVFVADYTYRRIRAICLNSTEGFCSGKTVARSYRLGGTGAAGDGNTGAPGATPMGTLTAITVDDLSNIYVGDSQYFRVRAVCYDVGPKAGFCTGKVANTIHRVTGTGVAGNGAEGGNAGTSPIGIPTALATDKARNVFFADHTYYMIRALCFDVSQGHCAGATPGGTYRLIGSGLTGGRESNTLGPSMRLGSGGYGGLTFTALGSLLRTDSYNTLRLFMKP